MRIRGSADQGESIEEIRAKQRNLIWPDTLVNSRSVDKFLLRGSADASLVQRMAAWLWGLAFLAASALLLVAGRQFAGEGGTGMLFLSIPVFFLGTKIFLNGFRRPKRKTRHK
jgi:hypothetical protein